MNKRSDEVGESSHSKRPKLDDSPSTRRDLVVYKEVEQTPFNYLVQQSFQDFKLHEILKFELEKLKYFPTRVQALSLPHILKPNYESLIAQAHFGSGKTLTFLLAMVNKLSARHKAVQGICICPSFAMIFQCMEELKKLGVDNYGITLGVIKGQNTTVNDYESHIIFGTPLTLFPAVMDQKLDLTIVGTLVLDESDALLQLKLGKIHLNGIWNEIRRRSDSTCQVLAFASTLSLEASKTIQKIFREKEFTKILLERKDLFSRKIKHLKVYMENQESKIRFIWLKLLAVSPPNKVIVFVNTEAVERQVADTLKGYYKVVTYTDSAGSREYGKLRDFKSKGDCVLITTDLLSCGFDAPRVEVIVNFEMPPEGSCVETYLRRGGRTGRMGRPGVVVNLLTTHKDYTILENIERQLDFTCTLVPHFCKDRLAASVKQQGRFQV